LAECGFVAEGVWEERVAGEHTTFKVYVYLLRVREASTRQVCREVGLSSPSLALHHLQKLEGLKLVSRDRDGVYHVVPRKFGVLKFFTVTGRWLVPRTFFYMLFYVAVAVGSLVLLPAGMREVAVFLSCVGVILNFVETVRFLRLIP